MEDDELAAMVRAVEARRPPGTTLQSASVISHSEEGSQTTTAWVHVDGDPPGHNVELEVLGEVTDGGRCLVAFTDKGGAVILGFSDRPLASCRMDFTGTTSGGQIDFDTILHDFAGMTGDVSGHKIVLPWDGVYSASTWIKSWAVGCSGGGGAISLRRHDAINGGDETLCTDYTINTGGFPADGHAACVAFGANAGDWVWVNVDGSPAGAVGAQLAVHVVSYGKVDTVVAGGGG